MIVTEMLNTERERIDSNTKSTIDNILSNREMTLKGYFPSYGSVETKERKTITLSLLNIIFLRHIYKYFNEDLLVEDIDELLYAIVKESDMEYINHVTSNFKIDYNRKYSATRDFNGVVRACSVRLFKLFGNSFHEKFDCSRGSIEEVVNTAICCRNFHLSSEQGYSIEDVDKVNKYLKAMVQCLYFTALNTKDKLEIESIGEKLINLVVNNTSFYPYIIAKFEAHRTLLGIKVNTRKYHSKLETKVPAKPCLLLSCTCGSTEPPVWVHTKAYKTTVQITYKCHDCDRTFKDIHPISEKVTKR